MPAEFVDNSPDCSNRYFPQGNRGKPLQPWGHALMQQSFSVKKRCPRAIYRMGPTAAKPPPSDRRHSGVLSPTDINPYSAPVIRGHMCLVC